MSREQVLELALKYQIATQMTSWIAVLKKPSRDPIEIEIPPVIKPTPKKSSGGGGGS